MCDTSTCGTCIYLEPFDDPCFDWKRPRFGGGIQIYTYIYIHLLYAYSCMHASINSARELFLAHVFFVQTVCFSCIRSVT